MKVATKVGGGITLVAALTVGTVALISAQSSELPLEPPAPVSVIVEEPAATQAPTEEAEPEMPAPEPVIEEVEEPVPPARMSIPSGGALPPGPPDTTLCESSSASTGADGRAYCD